MRPALSEGDAAGTTLFHDNLANSFDAWTHDDKACRDDTDIHLDYGDGQWVYRSPWQMLHIGPNVVERKELALRVALCCGIRVQHEHKPSNSTPCVTDKVGKHFQSHCIGHNTAHITPRRMSPMSCVTSGRVCLILLSAGRGITMTKTLVIMFTAAVDKRKLLTSIHVPNSLECHDLETGVHSNILTTKAAV